MGGTGGRFGLKGDEGGEEGGSGRSHQSSDNLRRYASSNCTLPDNFTKEGRPLAQLVPVGIQYTNVPSSKLFVLNVISEIIFG